jgi:hypothetical protein
LRGAEAVKTDDAILTLLESNIDLAVFFAEDSVKRRILLNPKRVELHGALIAALMVKSALEHQATVTRSYRRQYGAWLQRREFESSLNDEGRPYSKRAWEITPEDVANIAEATFLIEGTEAGLASLRSWRPRRFALQAADIVISRLVARSRTDLVEPLLSRSDFPSFLKAFVAVPLARTDHFVEQRVYEEIVRDPALRKLLLLRKVGYGRDEREWFQFFDKYMTVCELSARTLAHDPDFEQILTRLSAIELRKTARLYDHDVDLLNIMIRAYTLSAAIDGVSPTVEDFLCIPENPTPTTDDSERRRQESLRTVVGILINFFKARVQTFVGRQYLRDLRGIAVRGPIPARTWDCRRHRN